MKRHTRVISASRGDKRDGSLKRDGPPITGGDTGFDATLLSVLSQVSKFFTNLLDRKLTNFLA